jgi:hypothetical protein
MVGVISRGREKKWIDEIVGQNKFVMDEIMGPYPVESLHQMP